MQLHSTLTMNDMNKLQFLVFCLNSILLSSALNSMFECFGIDLQTYGVHDVSSLQDQMQNGMKLLAAHQHWMTTDVMGEFRATSASLLIFQRRVFNEYIDSELIN